MSSSLPLNIPDGVILKCPWNWTELSPEMIDILFTDYYSRYKMFNKLKSIIRNGFLNIDILKDCCDTSYLYFVILGAYKNLINLKKLCAIHSSYEYAEYQELIIKLHDSFECVQFKNNAELQKKLDELKELLVAN